jgi:uncharacterized small protein (TIGR04563 family)
MPRNNDSSPSLPTERSKGQKSLYFKADILAQLEAEAARLDRSFSWVVAKACSLGIDALKRIPSMPDNG